ncbi:alpha/beta fold hydrolase [Streptomyces albidoflavus]|uniref:alpha/beta fold hydrolase n=1 Tax=Streptomyces albidoflavus TaxID=1886 RepID=UPI003454EB56
MPPPTPRTLHLRGRRFSCLDFGGPGPTLLALHGHFGRGTTYAPLAAALTGRYRVLAPDLRGHGLSDNGGTFTLEEYVADTAALLHALELTPAAVLGHSMGGAIAFLLAERHPELVQTLVVADTTVKNQPPETQPILDITDWPRRVPSREALREAVETLGIPDTACFLDSAHHFPDGWGFLFDQAALAGDFSTAWVRSAGPPRTPPTRRAQLPPHPVHRPLDGRRPPRHRTPRTPRLRPLAPHGRPGRVRRGGRRLPGQPTPRRGHTARAPVSDTAHALHHRPSPNPITRARSHALTLPHLCSRNPSLLTSTPHPLHLAGTPHSSPLPPLPPQVSGPPLQPLAATIFIARRHSA